MLLAQMLNINVIISGIPLTVLDGVPVTTVDPLPAPSLPPDPPECVARYAQYLKFRYKRMPTLPDGDWPPSLGRQYTRLAMIEQERELPGAELVATMERDYIHGNIDNIVKRKKAVQLPEIFLPPEDGGQQLKILMDGAPGVGKSTLSRKICKDWVNGELLQQYHLVILLALRQATIRAATTIEGLIDADDPDLKQQVVRHIQQTSGEHVLLVVDGYDELSYKDRTQDSFFLDIVKGMKFAKCSVLVTSRPYASDNLQCLESINRHVEVLGFTEEQIEHCILHNIPDKTKAVELVQMLKERQDIVSLCYIPLNCAIVLYVYKMEQCTLPNSLTELYEVFILNSIKRHACITGNDSITMGLHVLAEIPESFQKHLNVLSKLAYDGLVMDKLVFSIKDIKTAFPNCSDLDIININLLSLMTVLKEFTSTGEELSYQFLHLTIQEFLAARWAASQLSNDELLQFFQDHVREDRYRMMLLFLAGISHLEFPSAEDLFIDDLDFGPSGRMMFSKPEVVDYFLLLGHLIYESQNFSLFHNLAGTIVGGKLVAAWYNSTPFDCLILAYFLAWCDSSLKFLDLHCCHLTNQFLETLHKVNVQHHGTTQIEEVDLSNNPKVLTTLSLLPKLPVFAHTSVLKACDLLSDVPKISKLAEDDSEAVWCAIDRMLNVNRTLPYDQIGLHHLLNMKHLTTLEVSVNEKNPSETKCFLSLDKFQLQNGNILSHNAVDIFRSLEHNTTVKALDLSGNSQLAEGDSEAVGCAIERMLNVNATLKVLNLSYCGITDPIVKHILTGLTKNTSLVKLDMRPLKLSVSCAVSLFQQMTTYPTLSITVGEVNVLGVGRVMLDRKGLCCVMSNFNPDKCVEFFRALKNRGLSVLSLIVQNLTDQTAEHFAVGLAESQSIQELKLEHCNITSAGAVSILISLEHNTSLKKLDLSGNNQLAEGDSEAVGCVIERILIVSQTLKVLNLSYCSITDPIVKRILTGLTKNKSLVTVNMELPKLSVSCAVSLFQQMTTHPTLSISVGEVNVLGVGRVKMDRKGLCCVISNFNPDKCVEFFRALKNRGLRVLSLIVQDLTDQTAEHFAVGLAESQSIQELKLKHCKISSAGAVSILRSLKQNTSLEKLDLSGNSQLAEGDSEVVGCVIERMLSVSQTLKVLNLSYCAITDPIVKRILTGLTKNKSLVRVNMESAKLSVSCAVSLFQQMTTYPNLSITVGEVNVLGIGSVKMGRGRVCCIKSNFIPDKCVEFFRALNNSGLRVSNLIVQNLTDQTAKHFAIGLAEIQSVQALKFSHGFRAKNNITSIGAASIFTLLEHNTSLEELDLSGNSQLADGDSEAVCYAIERMLSGNRTLKVLNLRGCNITDPIVKCILTGLTKNTSLVTLDMRSPILSGTCAVSLFQQMTTHPTLSITVGEVNVMGVGKVTMDRGTVWCVLCNTISGKKCVEFFRALNNSGLKVSNLIVQNLTDQTAKHFAVGLAESQSVQALKFSHGFREKNSITSASAVSVFRSLEHNTSLKDLDLSGNIGSAGAVSIFRSLEHNTSLEELDLSENSQLAEGDSEPVGCAIERMLNVNRTLKVLNLSGCNITDPIANHILTALMKNTSLVTLHMGSCKLSAGCAVSLLQQVTTHPTLSIVSEVNVLGVGRVKMNKECLRFNFNDLFHESCVEFFTGLKNNGLKVPSLIVEDLTDREAEHLAVGLTGSQWFQALKLKHMHVNFTNVGAVRIFRSLEHNTSLEELDLSGNRQLARGNGEAVGCGIERMLNVNRTLKVLNLNDCGLDTVVATHIFRSLEHNTTLEELDLSENWQLTVGNSEAVGCPIERILNVNRTLKVLNLSGCNITDPIVKRVLSRLTNNTLPVIIDMGAPKISVRCAMCLMQNNTIRPTPTIPTGVVNVLGVGMVTMDRGSLWCVLWNTISDKCVEFFRALNNSGIKVSILNVQNLTDQTARDFSVGLAESQSVHSLNLNCSWKEQTITSTGAMNIFRSLEHNTSLKKLDLSGNWQLAEVDSDAVGCAIERVLNVNRTLKVLNLSGFQVTDPIAKHILTGLMKNTSLVRLVIGSAKLSVSCAVSLLQQTTTYLSRVHVGEVNVLGVGNVKMDRRTVCCVIGDMIPESCVEFFRALNNSGLKVSNLIVQNLTDQTAKHFAIGLTESQSVQALKFSHSFCNITSADAVSILRSLEHNTTLKELDLSGNSQLAESDSEAVGCAIERMLSVNRTLRVLELSSCNVTDPIVKHILTGLMKNTSIVTLHMGSPKLSGSCAVSFFQQMTTHHTLSRVHVGEVNVLGVGRVKMDRGSLWCVIGDTIPVNCVGFFRALNNSGMKVSKWNVQDLTDQTAEHFAVGLAESQSVQTLKLEHCNITSAGAVSIFRSLEHNTSLEKLDLSGNSQLAEDGSEAVGCTIERMLNVNRTLEVLNLSGCNITDPIIKHILIGLTKNTSLVTLNIGSSKLSHSCAVSLFQQMTTHPTLSISEVTVLGVGSVKMDKGSLWCVVGDLIPENCVEFFRDLNNSGLKVSNLIVQDLTDQTAEHFAVGLAESQSIQALKLEHCNISSTGAVSILRSLEHNTTLKELDLSENSQLAESDSETVGCAIERMLNVNRTLKVLNLNDCNVTDAIVKHILTGLTKNTSLVTLNMGSPKLSCSSFVSLFQKMTTHPTLSITVGEMNVLGVGRVMMDRGGLSCIMNDCVEFIRALNNSGLKVSTLIVQDLTDQTAEHFAVGLAESQLVQALKLEHCNISSVGAVSIFRSLEHNTSLEELDLSGNSQLAESYSEAVGCAIERMLIVNRTLKVLNLCGCQVTDPIAKHVLTGLTKNTSLTTLHMGSCKLSVGCAVSLLQLVTIHPTLQPVGWLNVLKVGNVEIQKGNVLCVESRIIPEHCMEKYVEFFRALNDSDVRVSKLKVKDLTDQTAEHLAIVLAEYKSVQALDLKHNKISSAGVVHIFRSLEHNTSLEELDLSWNSQLAEGDSEAVGCAIERMLNVNRILKVLNLNRSNVTDPIVKHILTGLTKNTSLETLDMGSPKLSGSCAVSLFQKMTAHPTLSRVHVGEMNVLGVGKVTLDRRTATVSLLYNLGNMIPENCVDFIRAINHSDMVSRLKIVQPFTYKSAEYIAGLTRSLSVQALDFKHCNISSGDAVSIFRSLEHNTNLEELDLSGNWRLAEGDSEAVGCAIEMMLSVNRTLKILNIHNCGLGTPVATHIAAGLVHNSSLTELSIGLNHSRKLNRSVVLISKEGCVDVIKALCNNTSLKKLDISGSNLEMKGSEALAEMLSCNKSLTELNIGGCRISKAGLREIARGLLQNSSLRTLKLWTTRCKASFETEIERLKSSQDFTPQSLKKIEIKAVWQ